MILSLACLLIPARVLAQSGPQATLSQPDTQNFPTISAYLSVYDSEGRVVRGLTASDVQIRENDQLLPLSELTYLEPGVQFVVAINPGPSFAIRNSQGTSRYDLIKETLQTWAASIPDDRPDDLSLITTTGPRASHLSDPDDWLLGLTQYEPDSRNLTPSFDILSTAIDLAADTTPQPGMGRAVLFITPPPDATALPALQNLVVLAQQAGVRVSVWMIASLAAFDTPGVTQLSELAFQTGGSSFRYSGIEAFPAIDSYLEPLRGIYQLSYASPARSSGDYQVSAELNLNSGETLATPPMLVPLEILPPNPVFISPPTTIERELLESEDATATLIPTIQSLQILIEYPDGKPRPIERSALLVDGEQVDENLEAPFDSFVWDIRAYDQNGEHLVKVVLEDALGLQGESIEAPIRITIAGQPTGIAAVLVKQAPLIAILAALAAGAVLLWVLVVGGRLRPVDVTKPRNRRRDKDPVTQPVPIRSERRASPSPARRLVDLANRLRWPQRRTPNKPLAFLELLGEDGNGARGVSRPILETEITFGSSIARATNLLEDDSVSDLHARLEQRSSDEFWIFDTGSTAGTWVNYAQVPASGTRLVHGDLIHIGRVGYRFRLPDESYARRIVITQKSKPS